MKHFLELDAAKSAALEEAFPVCPECGAPWKLHWKYVRETGGLKRRYNTCGRNRAQLEAKWLDRSKRS